MKKTMFLIISVFMLSLISCSKDNVEAEIPQNWIFTIKTTTTYTPDSENIEPVIVITTEEHYGLTSTEADAIIKYLTKATSTTNEGITATVSVTVTKAVKKA